MGQKDVKIYLTCNFSGAKSKNLQANTAACLSSLAKNHRENQDLVVAKGAVKPLVCLAKSTKTLCQVKAASALESLATSNPEAQKEIDAADAQKPLIRLLKMWAIEVKEQGLCTLITQNARIFFLCLFLAVIFLNQFSHFTHFFQQGEAYFCC